MIASSKLPFTGERFTPQCKGRIWHEHWHRYLMLAELVRGKVVLDAACGEGYGSAFLARSARCVTGVDLDEAAISHANNRYADISSLDFQCASALKLPLLSGSVDVVISFETLEHLTEQEELLTEFRRVLAPEGCLVISSPNRPVYSDLQSFTNEYHLKELDRRELAELLSRHFEATRWYAQRFLFQSVVWSLNKVSGPLAGEFLQHSSAADTPEPGTLDVMYFLVVCGANGAMLPTLPDLSALAECEQKIDADPQGVNLAMLERQTVIADLESKLAHATAEIDMSAALVGENAGIVEERRSLSNRIEALEGRLAYRESVVGWLRAPFAALKRRLSGR